jgi:hypothetical protein
MRETDPVLKQVIAEQRKEIARLQKLIAKTEVRKDSEIARLRAKLAEATKTSHLQVVRIVVDPKDEAL